MSTSNPKFISEDDARSGRSISKVTDALIRHADDEAAEAASRAEDERRHLENRRRREEETAVKEKKAASLLTAKKQSGFDLGESSDQSQDKKKKFRLKKRIRITKRLWKRFLKTKSFRETFRPLRQARRMHAIGESAAKTAKAGQTTKLAMKVLQRARLGRVMSLGSKADQVTKAGLALSKVSKYAKLVRFAKSGGALAARGGLKMIMPALGPFGIALLALDVGWFAYQKYTQYKETQADDKKPASPTTLSILNKHHDGNEDEILHELDDHFAADADFRKYCKEALRDPAERHQLLAAINTRLHDENNTDTKISEQLLENELRSLIQRSDSPAQSITKTSGVLFASGISETETPALTEQKTTASGRN